MKKVLYISYDGMTDPLGQSQVIPYLASLSKEGFRFTILSAEKKDRLQKNEPIIRKLLEENNIDWEYISFSTRPPVISKIYDQYKLTAKASRLHRREHFDLVHCRSYVAAETGLSLKRRFNVPFLFDMRGFWVNERVDSGLWDLKKPFYRYFFRQYKRKELQYFRESAHIISLTHRGKDELADAYAVKPEKISVIPCCADLDHFDYNRMTAESKKEIRKKLGIPEGKKVLSYLGSLGGWYMTEEMLDFYAVVEKRIPGTVFLFITHDKRDSILKMSRAKGIADENIFVQPAARLEVPFYLGISDWSVFFIKDVYSKKASSPTKQGELMAMGIPLICNDIGDTGHIVRDSGAGIVINEFNSGSYQSASEKMPALLDISKQSIRTSAFKYYNLEDGVRTYLKVYSDITSKSGSRKTHEPKSASHV